jgi:transcriptional regulator with XRE-family HTH domain
MKDLYENIRSLRRFKGWKQETMAELLEMSPNAYANIEQGKTDLKLSRLEQIAKVLEVDLADLLSFDRSVFFIHNSTAHYQLVNSSCTTTSNFEHELEKARLQLEQKDKEMAYSKLLLEQKDKEIAYLKEILELRKKASSVG